MDLERLSEKKRCEIMAEIADLYYNQGKTQAEIARTYESNRFRIAKLLQDARTEGIVEIQIHHVNERNLILEEELKKVYPLNKAIIVDTQYSPYIHMLTQLGRAGAAYLTELLTPDTVIGITWGKTIFSVISQLTEAVRTPITAVQVTGNSRHMNPATDPRELVRLLMTKYPGTSCFLDAPLYIRDASVRSSFLKEPAIRETMQQTRHMDIIVSGIGSRSSLPLTNPQFESYLTESDIQKGERCLGSLYGYVLDESGQIADLDLNRKLVSAALPDILTTPHRLVVACGRHKAAVLSKALDNRLFNELLTDTTTARYLLEKKENSER